MATGKTILEHVGASNLLCFTATNFVFGKSDKKTHYGYLEFSASRNTKIPEPVRVRVEHATNDTYTVKVFDFSNTNGVIKHKLERESHTDVYSEDLIDFLFDLLG